MSTSALPAHFPKGYIRRDELAARGWTPELLAAYEADLHPYEVQVEDPAHGGMQRWYRLAAVVMVGGGSDFRARQAAAAEEAAEIEIRAERVFQGLDDEAVA